VLAVILAGGLGTRLKPAAKDIPKSMVLVEGKPFLEYEMDLFKRSSINDFVICVGYRGDMIREYFGNGKPWGISVTYSDDGDKLLGTAGSLKNAASFLSDRFFVTYGDAYPILDFKSAEERFLESGKLALMVVYRNSNRYGRSNTVVDNGLVVFYSKTESSPGMEFIEFGVTLMRKKALELIPNEYPVDLEVLYQRIIAMKQMAAFEVGQRIYDIGSPESLAEFRQLVASGKLVLP
jgi:NDP-sugar pyrophosphorylase family protein